MDTSNRCFLRNLSPGNPLAAKTTVYTATATKGVHLYRLIHTPKGYIAVTPTQDDVDKLLTPTLVEALRGVNLEPTQPLDHTARHTIFIRGVDAELGAQDAPTLLKSLKDSNSDLKFKEVIKIPGKDRYFKAICSDLTTVKAAT